jgi:hypothetical protein
MFGINLWKSVREFCSASRYFLPIISSIVLSTPLYIYFIHDLFKTLLVGQIIWQDD